MPAKRYMNIICFALCVILSVIFINIANITTQASKEGLELCIKTIIPVLFPHFVLSKIMLELLRENKNTKAIILTATVLGITCGTPVGASIISDLHKRQIVSDKDAGLLLISTACPSPAFCISMIGENLFDNKTAGAIIWLVGVTIALSISIPVTLLGRSATINISNNAEKLSGIITKSIYSGIESCLRITGSVVVFYIIANVTLNALTLPPEISVGFASLLEITTGTVLSARLLNKSGIPHAAFAAIFGGLSVYTQIASVAPNVPKKHYLQVKFILGIAAYIILKAFTPFFGQHT